MTTTQAQRTEDRHFDGLTARIRWSTTATSRWLVLVHGLGESGHCFRHLLDQPQLRGWNLLLPDLPGYGRSPHLERALSLPEFADLLIEWLPTALDELSDSRPTVRGTVGFDVVFLGHSMGGVIGQLFCERVAARPEVLQPARLRGFVNVEGNLSPGDCGHSAIAAPRALPEYIETGHQELVHSIWLDGHRRPADRSYFVSASLADPRAYHHNSVELVELSDAEHLAGRFASLPLPKSFLHGSPDGTAPRSLELLRSAEVTPRACAPAGHWPFIDQPDQFTEHLAAFLDSLQFPA